MRSTQQFSVTLPNEMAAEVRAKVASGEYASESEVIRDGLRALRARDRAVDHWLHNEVVPAYAALKADPSGGSTLEDLRAAFGERHASQTGQTRKS
jgi:antitoxin ParD1/3/4